MDSLLALGAGGQDWAILRRARLAALTDSPGSFGSTVDDEADRSAEDWIRTLADARWAVIEDEAEPVGLVALREASDVPDCDCWISSWWVAPRRRGSGVADTLLEWIDGVCRVQGWHHQGLGVWVENTGAQRAFARRGFLTDGVPRDSRHFPGRRYVRMLRTIPEG